MPSFGYKSTADQVLRDFDLSGKNILITGSNAGVGYESALSFAKHKANVYATFRSQETADKALADLKSKSGSTTIFPVILELGDLATIRKAVSELAGIKFDVVMLNAGLATVDRQTTKDGFEKTFGVNHLGHFLLGNLLIDQLNDNARVVVVASNAPKFFLRREGLLWDDLMYERTKFGTMEVYSQSKMANIYYAYQLNKVFKEKKIKASAYSANPGGTSTSFNAREQKNWTTRFFAFFTWAFGKTAAQGAGTQVYVSTAPEINPETDGGKYYSSCKAEILSVHTQEPQIAENAKRLWDVSLKYVGLQE